ncbi:hypothetical protein [Polaromonas sp.]|uniref:hypothetical protein n=1 Tax=Polaromonas sp. TaxID=1869339 RepID=UPI0025EBAF4C|nr:hypothetical protein [Polaromonas sp.]
MAANKGLAANNKSCRCWRNRSTESPLAINGALVSVGLTPNCLLRRQEDKTSLCTGAFSNASPATKHSQARKVLLSDCSPCEYRVAAETAGIASCTSFLGIAFS